jgi:hypothetical protein
VIDIALEVPKALEGRRVSFTGKANAGDKPTSINLGAIRALNQPLLTTFVKDGTVDVLVEGSIVLYIPLLFHVLEVFTQLLPSGVSILEGEVFPQLLVEELVNGRVGVDASPGITVPIPDAARGTSLLEDANLEA